jgi:predicted nucleic acid-binding protein
VLLKTNNLFILKDLFEKIAVPTAVYKEITAKEQEKIIFDKIDWIETRKSKNTQENVLIEKLIDKGEAEAIVLAKELKTTLLLDDAKARKYAKLLNVGVIGTLGLLKIAKKSRRNPFSEKSNQRHARRRLLHRRQARNTDFRRRGRIIKSTYPMPT